MRKVYWYLSAYLRKHGSILIVSIVGAILLFSLLVPTLAKTIERNKKYYVGIVGQFTIDDLPDTIANQLSSGLTQIEPDGSVSPLLAERWIVEHDGTSYRFLLSDEFIWQDGKPLEPEDVSFNFPDTETVVTPNDIVFKLPDSFSPFPAVVSRPILRPTTITKYLFFSKPSYLGISQFQILDYQEQNGYLKELVVDGPNERYIYRFYLTEEDAVTAYKHGRVDVLPDLVKVHDVMNWRNTQVTQELQTNRYLAVFFNINLPIFDKNIRQGLNYALPKVSGAERAVGPISPDSWAYLEGGKSYDQDWERGSERMLDVLPPAPLNIELTTTSLFADEAEEIKKVWDEFGEKVYQDCQNSDAVEDKSQCENVRIVTDVKITNFPDTSNFQVLLIGQESPPDPDQYALWHSDQSTNFTGYKNTRIDGLLEKGRQTFDQSDRREIYQEFQQFFLEDSPAIFLKHLYSFRVERR